MTTTMTAPSVRHLLPGLRPDPLASYLAGLGLFRVLATQADAAATIAWTPGGLALTTTVPDIAAWLANEYEPTPVLNPWNNGSGFGPKDKEPLKALEKLLAHPSFRLADLRENITRARKVTTKAREKGWLTETGAADKRKVVQALRNDCTDRMLDWIDAAVVLSGIEDVSFPPLLGSGGNDGRLDFSTNFHQRLLEVIGVTDAQHRRSLVLARDLLDGTQAEPLAKAAIGQFDPGAAGGPGSSRFGAAESLVNPWEYILLIEGAQVFAASAVRRNQQYGLGEKGAAVPFTVQGSPDGTATGAAGEETRGELWAPVWTRDFAYPEVRQLFGEARASWRGRPARRAVDFYAAAHSLGVARGIDEFFRYGFQRRNGLAFTAVLLDRVPVRRQLGTELAAQVEDWVSRISAADVSAALRQARRRFDAAHLAFARDGGALPLARMLAALTDLELAVGHSGRAKETVPVRRPPAAQVFLDFLLAADATDTIEVNTPELRLAVGLASCTTYSAPDAGQASRSLRQILFPLDPAKTSERNRAGHWRDSSLVPGFGVRPLPRLLADVLAWRSRTAAAEDHHQQFRGVPTFRSGILVPAADLHDFAVGALDEAALDLWLRACLALDWSRVRCRWKPAAPGFPVPVLALLHPLARGMTSAEARTAARKPTEDTSEPRLALRPDWAARLAAGQIHGVHREAALRLRQAGWQAVAPAPGNGRINGTWIAAALVPRCLKPVTTLEHFATPLGNDEKSDIETIESTPEEQS